MKQFVYLALIGALSSDTVQAIRFRPNGFQQPWSKAAPAGPSGILKTGYNVEDKDAIFYERVIPENFSQDSDDKLMRSLISKYSVEGRTDDLPNGNFVLSQDGAASAAKEAVRTHFGWNSEKTDAYVKERMSEFWQKGDVLNQGWIPVAKGPVLLKSILGEVEINNKLQLQLADDIPSSDMNVQFRPNSFQQPWSKAAPAGPSGILKTGYNVEDKGAIFYDRVIPENFSQDSDDKLMRSLISQYAVEGRTDDLPNGNFVLSKDGATQAAKEVVGSHFGWKGEQRDNYVNEQMKEIWTKHDVLNQGWIPVAKGPVLLKSLVGEVEMNNKLQVQLQDDTPENNTNVQFRPNSTQQPWSSKPSAGPTGKIVGAYKATDGGSVFYDRDLPDNFSDDSDDKFMRSIIKTYSLEGKTNNEPNGAFYLDKNGAEGVAKEIVGTHFGWTGDKKDNYAKKRVNELWSRFDVLGEGFVDVQKAPVMMRTLLGEVEIGNKLQMQTQEDLRLDENQSNQFRPNKVQQPWSYNAPAGPTGTIVGAYKVADKNSSFYDREIPENFQNGNDDLLMKSLLTNYTLEGRTNDEPNGKFYLTKNGAKSVAKEVVGSHFGWTGDKRDQYVEERIGEFWPNHDVLNEGFIDAAKGPVLLKSVLGEAEINNKLQLQTLEDMNQKNLNKHHKRHHHHENSNIQNKQEVVFRPDTIQSPWAMKEADKPKQSVVDTGFRKHSTRSIYYDRAIPGNFEGENSDRLMNSLIGEYSVEGKDLKTKLPNGRFYLDKVGAEHIADEVIKTHLKMNQSEANAYAKKNFPAIWDHADILKKGFIEVERAPVMLRAVVGEVEAQGGLQ